jgi:RNA polymerase sigma-70 factor (ECF subfamily)
MVRAARPLPNADAPPSPAERGDFRALYKAHFPFVWRTLLHFGVPSAFAEDAAQEVFVTLHRRLDDYDGSVQLRSWLWGICRGVAHTHRRSAWRAERRASVAPPPSPAPSPDAALERQRAAALVQDVLASMTEELRDVFVLIEIEGLNAAEAAQAVGANVNTVSSRLRLARAAFERAAARVRAREARVSGEREKIA